MPSPTSGGKAQAGAELDQISVLVPRNPFVPSNLSSVRHCLCALDVEKLMKWWPGLPHQPNRDALKVQAIQRSLDWKRVAQIAAYLLQEEIDDAPAVLDKIFSPIYEPRKNEPGESGPPRYEVTLSLQEAHSHFSAMFLFT